MKNILPLITFLSLCACGEKKKENMTIASEEPAIESPLNTRADEYLKTDKFEVMSVETRVNNLKNIKVLLKTNQKSEKHIETIVKEIRAFYAPYKANINVFDTIEGMEKADIYPLKGSDRSVVAKHFIAMSSFDAPEVVWMYPIK
ncbi:hypothetical protein KRE47_10785 [Elizabethkingia meningoseptica]|uniref:hypothetical protein n=2 Tax=Elizabethkingia meningoseptica TaxID=238 RepID=UPI0011168C74|nr:hypothetical protein [Elizabethkingia meningoseptica]EJK5329930.1 hypothetical protein [Elizabethkingia meningoseptica]MDE5468624.1 hypothetical protein [Elizabethkingia meningoseptica]MDE5475936.1 hypothetical protein [Elizabethkingia meningoseptica]MDE5478871.1 hypothetical protein [Elizabethkingia meningoseptica]MDE5484820.1 hypothetical protein [Elizabethkingia meningoseptica]